jgi:hypothetical protein
VLNDKIYIEDHQKKYHFNSITIESVEFSMDNNDAASHHNYERKDYIKKRDKLKSFFFETALPNEYLVQIGKKNLKPILGGRMFKFLRKFIRVPASVQTLYFKTDNANMDYQGIGIEGYASWRIDPQRPHVSITTLDFFDEDDPMRNTNNKLKTICIEAVRHVISNMSIDEALKQKEEIAKKLKSQLTKIEENWGLIFDQVGIESVKIMSNKLFEELQAQYRDHLRLDVSKNRIYTDREIAKEENSIREKNEMERLETDKKLDLVSIENETKVKESELLKDQKIEDKEREIKESNFRKEIEFNKEQEEKRHDLEKLKKDLEIELQIIEKKYLESQQSIDEMKNMMAKKDLEIEKMRKEISQIFSEDALTEKFIDTLPTLFSYLQIDNYSVFAGGSDNTISPVSKILQELIFTVKNSDLSYLLKEKQGEKSTVVDEE